MPPLELAPRLEEANMRGKIRVRLVLRVGKQEQMMPMLTSRLLQSAAIGLSQLMSFDTETAYSDWRRSRDTMHVMPPKQKTKVNARRWRLGRFKLLMTGRGSMAIATSVRILKPALVNLD